MKINVFLKKKSDFYRARKQEEYRHDDDVSLYLSNPVIHIKRKSASFPKPKQQTQRQLLFLDNLDAKEFFV